MLVKETTKITLPFPIKTDDEGEIKEVVLTEPYAGELRGLKFGNIMEADVDTMVTLMPRISTLTERQIINMKPSNLTALIAGALGFFAEDDSLNE